MHSSDTLDFGICGWTPIKTCLTVESPRGAHEYAWGVEGRCRAIFLLIRNIIGWKLNRAGGLFHNATDVRVEGVTKSRRHLHPIPFQSNTSMQASTASIDENVFNWASENHLPMYGGGAFINCDSYWGLYTHQWFTSPLPRPINAKAIELKAPRRVLLQSN